MTTALQSTPRTTVALGNLVDILIVDDRRENLLALTVFNALHSIRTGHGARRFLTAAVLQLPPFAVYLLNRRHPVFLPLYDTGPWPMLAAWGRRFLLDPGWQEVSLLAYCNSLGLLFILALLCWRGVVRFLGKYYEWAYYVVVGRRPLRRVARPGRHLRGPLARFFPPGSSAARLALLVHRPGCGDGVLSSVVPRRGVLPLALRRARHGAHAGVRDCVFVGAHRHRCGDATRRSATAGSGPQGVTPPAERAARTIRARSGMSPGPSNSAPATWRTRISTSYGRGWAGVAIQMA